MNTAEQLAGLIMDADLPARHALEIMRLRAVLKEIAEYCSKDGSPLGAIERLVAIRNTAERALRHIR